MSNLFTKLWTEERGQGLAEYGLILALVAVVAIAGLNALSGGINARLNDVGTKLTPPADPPPAGG